MDVVRTANQGWIEVIVGSMFSGKSEELIRRLRRAQIARQRVQIFKPAVDTRFADDAHRVAQRAAAVGRAGQLVGRPAEQGAARHRSGRHRRGPVLRRRAAGRLRRAGRARRAGDRRRPRPGLPGPAVRADAAPAGDRRVHHQDAGHLRGLRQPGQSHPAAGAQRRPGAARRPRHLRGALPPLFRSAAVAAGIDRAGETPPTD